MQLVISRKLPFTCDLDLQMNPVLAEPPRAPSIYIWHWLANAVLVNFAVPAHQRILVHRRLTKREIPQPFLPLLDNEGLRSRVTAALRRALPCLCGSDRQTGNDLRLLAAGKVFGC